MSAPIPFGNYELVERIAEGGMAEVWRARSRGVAGFEKTVVIKRVLPSLLVRPGFAELLVREAKIAARLSHPNVVQIYDLGEEEGGYYIAMEYLRGRDLAAALSHRSAGDGPFGLALRLWIGAEVAKALDYAHRVRGEDGKPLHIVHRDVSPQNVLLGFEGEVKVADFGIARADEAGLGRGEDPKILRGKYAYMSPEQARGEPLDRRSDIFSFGILLYELATRRRMFRGKTSAETLDLVRHASLPDFKKGLPVPGLEAILERALCPDKDARYASASEIHSDLTRLVFALGEPVGATDLAAAMATMFPPTTHVSPNKLQVDLLIRAYDDATSVSEVGRRVVPVDATLPSVDQTQALPSSKRLRAENRRIAFFAVKARPDEERLFETAVEGTGGTVLTTQHGMHIAAFGVSGMERAAGHAICGALELRRTTRLEGAARVELSPPMVVIAGEGRILEGVAVEPSVDVLERAAALLDRTEPGEVRVSADLRPELGRDFRLRDAGDALLVDGFRSRRDRDAGALRRRAPLVGRREILRTLSGMLVDAAQGRGELVHLIGEPGVGKSRLLAELRAAAAPRDFVFVHGRADEADTERSFGALSDLVHDLCGIEPEDAPAQRFEKVERLRVLGLMPREIRLVGELIGLAYPVATGERVGRPRGIEIALSIRRALRKLSEDRVVVLALEDLHWMDDATRQVLPLLTEGLVGGRVLILVTRRPGSTGSLPAGGRTLEVAPLSTDATGRLLAHWLGVRAVEPELAALVGHETGGIPGWIELVAPSLVDALVVEHGVARVEGAPGIPIPDSVRSVVAARIERLRPRDRSMLRVVAALGGTVELRLVSAIEGLVGHSERPPLRRLLVRRLVVSEDRAAAPPERLGAWGGDEGDARLPTHVRVPSELLRRAVLAELDEGDSRRLHGRIVATLERLGAGDTLEGLEQLARHALCSIDRRRAPDYSMRAGEAALARGEGERAARHFASAAEVLRDERDDATDPEAFVLGLRAAKEALSVGALDLAALALAPLANVAGRVDPSLSVQRALVEAELACGHLEPALAVMALEVILPELARVEPSLRTEVRLRLGDALLECGETDRAIATIEEAAREARGGAEGRALAGWALALVAADRISEADRIASESLAVAARLGESALRYASLAALAAVVEARGELAAASARYREAAEVALTAGAASEAPRLLAIAAGCALAVGDDVAAARAAEEAHQRSREARREVWGLVASTVQAALAIRAHPDASYVPGIVRAVDRLEALGRSAEASRALEMLAHAHVALGDEGAAARTLSRAEEHSARVGQRSRARLLAERRAALGAP